MTTHINSEDELKQKRKVLVLNFAKGYIGDGDINKEAEAIEWAEQLIDALADERVREAIDRAIADYEYEYHTPTREKMRREIESGTFTTAYDFSKRYGISHQAAHQHLAKIRSVASLAAQQREESDK